MVRIYKDFCFEAAHQLEGYEGACANLHGHSYKLRVGLLGNTVTKRISDEGFLMDFGLLKRKVKEIFLDEWDHSFLARGDEAVLGALERAGSKIVRLGFRPTAENMCRHILWQLHINGLPVESVRLNETDTSSAEAKIGDLIRAGGYYTDSVDSNSVDMSQELPVSEIFGPTIQGEGRGIGRKTLFLRTYGCDNKCTWCDTGYAWDGSEEPERMSLLEICGKLELLRKSNGCRHIVLTGGNPCIHGSAMEGLIRVLKTRGYSISLETQATVLPDWIALLDSVTLSPKAPSSGNTTELDSVRRFTVELKRLEIPCSIKVVVFDEVDLEYFKELYRTLPVDIAWYIQPGNEGGEFDLLTSIKRYKELMDKALNDEELTDVSVLPQLHTWLWGNGRGF